MGPDIKQRDKQLFMSTTHPFAMLGLNRTVTEKQALLSESYWDPVAA